METDPTWAPRPARITALAGELAGIAESLSAAARPPSQADLGVERVRDSIQARRHRDALFSQGLFSDPAWDILLELFACRLEQRQISVSALCGAAAAPATTALRRIGSLESQGAGVPAVRHQRWPPLLRRADRRRGFADATGAHSWPDLCAFLAKLQKQEPR